MEDKESEKNFLKTKESQERKLADIQLIDRVLNSNNNYKSKTRYEQMQILERIYNNIASMNISLEEYLGDNRTDVIMRQAEAMAEAGAVEGAVARAVEGEGAVEGEVAGAGAHAGAAVGGKKSRRRRKRKGRKTHKRKGVKKSRKHRRRKSSRRGSRRH